MTPPQDALEILVGQLEAGGFGAKDFVRASRAVLVALVEEQKRLRAENEALRAERQPFKVVVDDLLRTGKGDQHTVALAQKLGFKEKVVEVATLDVTMGSSFRVRLRSGLEGVYQCHMSQIDVTTTRPTSRATDRASTTASSAGTRA